MLLAMTRLATTPRATPSSVDQISAWKTTRASRASRARSARLAMTRLATTPRATIERFDAVRWLLENRLRKITDDLVFFLLKFKVVKTPIRCNF